MAVNAPCLLMHGCHAPMDVFTTHADQKTRCVYPVEALARWTLFRHYGNMPDYRLPEVTAQTATNTVHLALFKENETLRKLRSLKDFYDFASISSKEFIATANKHEVTYFVSAQIVRWKLDPKEGNFYFTMVCDEADQEDLQDNWLTVSSSVEKGLVTYDRSMEVHKVDIDLREASQDEPVFSQRCIKLCLPAKKFEPRMLEEIFFQRCFKPNFSWGERFFSDENEACHFTHPRDQEPFLELFRTIPKEALVPFSGRCQLKPELCLMSGVHVCALPLLFLVWYGQAVTSLAQLRTALYKQAGNAKFFRMPPRSGIADFAAARETCEARKRPRSGLADFALARRACDALASVSPWCCFQGDFCENFQVLWWTTD